jgi:2-pyrone-4,6-dicarboxylate lactonase
MATDQTASGANPETQLPFCPDPSKPTFVAPEGACDAHCHVFGPAAVFPFAPERKYTPKDAPKETLFALRRHLGLARSVIVQATCHGADNTALVDALRAGDGSCRGVAVVRPDVSDAELKEMDRAGVRAVRFNFLRRLVGTAPKDSYRQVAERIAPLGWHIVIYFEPPDLADLEPFIAALPTDVVVDHMGRPDVTKSVDDADFVRFRKLLADHPNIWVKVSGTERLTVAGPPYDDVTPFSATLVAEFPDRVIWGTDWPHPNMVSHMPDDGALVDLIPRFAPSAEAQRRLLVDNPSRLYWS